MMWLTSSEYARLAKQTADWTLDQLVALTEIMTNTVIWGDVQSAINQIDKVAQL